MASRGAALQVLLVRQPLGEGDKAVSAPGMSGNVIGRSKSRCGENDREKQCCLMVFQCAAPWLDSLKLGLFDSIVSGGERILERAQKAVCSVWDVVFR